MTETTPLNVQNALNENTSLDDVESGLTGENNANALELTLLNEDKSKDSKSTHSKWSKLVSKRPNVAFEPEQTNREANEDEDESAQGHDDIWSTISRLRSNFGRKGQVMEDCKTLEEACRYNNYLCAEKLLSAISKHDKKIINQMQYDQALVTASEHDSYDVIKLLSAAADFNPNPELCNTNNPHMDTPLHFAAKRRSLKVMKLLIEKGAEVNAANSSKRTPLHVIVGCTTSKLPTTEVEKANACLKLLLESSADPNLCDIVGGTPLHLAAMQSEVGFSNVLIANGANIYARHKAYDCSALKLLLKHCLESVITSLDKCIQIDPRAGKTQNANWKVKLDFLEKGGILKLKADGSANSGDNGESGDNKKSGDNVANERGDGTSPFITEILRIRDQDENDYLNIDSETSRSIKVVLEHPVSQIHLHQKWSSVKWFYYILMVMFHFIYSSMYTGYAIINFRVLCEPKDHFDQVWSLFDLGAFFGKMTQPVTCVHRVDLRTLNQSTFHHIRHHVYPVLGGNLLGVLFVALAIGTLLLLMREVTKMMRMNWSYFKTPDSYLVLCIIACYLLFMYHHNPRSADFQFRWYHYHAAAMGTWCTWIEMMLLLGKTPKFGVHVEMFRKVARSILKLFGAYFFIFLAFTTSFFLLFPSHFEYQSNLVMALTKVITMMTGEIGFDDLFFPTRAEITPKGNITFTISGQNITLPNLQDADINTFSKAQYYPGTSHFIGVLSILFCSIVIMNLILGIAVSDVQNLMEDATFFQQIQQARMINHMESVFFSRGFTRLAAIVLKRISNCCGLCKNMTIFKNVRFSRRGEQAVVGNPEYIVKPTSGSVPKRLKRKIEDRIREMNLEKNKGEDSDRKMEKHFKMMDGKISRLEEMIQGLLMITEVNEESNDQPGASCNTILRNRKDKRDMVASLVLSPEN